MSAIIAIYKIPRLISTIAITDRLNKKYKINIDSIKTNHKGSKSMYEYTSSYKEILNKRAKLQTDIAYLKDNNLEWLEINTLDKYKQYNQIKLHSS